LGFSDPTLPANGSPLSSAQMRSQLNGLHDEIANPRVEETAALSWRRVFV